MRVNLYCVALLLVLVGCEPPGPNSCGSFGCPEGERCVDTGTGETCVACGGAGETCCYRVNGGELCPASGVGCDPGDGPGTCSKECGEAGMACCDGTACDAESTCNNNEVCEPVTGGECFSGSTQYVFTIVDASCGYRSAGFWTNSLEEAEECRDQWSVVGPGEELCPPGVLPESSHVCSNGHPFGVILNHCSGEQLAACQANSCTDAQGCIWAECE